MSRASVTPSPSLPVRSRDVWRLAGPIMVANVSVPMLGVVDTAVMGHLPDPRYLGAVAVGAMVFSVIYWGFGFLRMGTGGLTAQAAGAHDNDEVRAVLARAVLLGLVLGGAVLMLQAPLAWGALAIVGASESVHALAAEYVEIRIWGAPFVFLNYAILGWLLGMHAPRRVVVLQVGMNVLNMVLDIWFVLGLGWGVEGVAWATLIAECSVTLLGFAMVAQVLRRHPGAAGDGWTAARVMAGDKIKRVLAVNRDIYLRTLFLQVVFISITAIGARLGDTVLAANAVLMNFQSVMAYALDAFADAAQALVGRAVGARDRAQLHAVVKAATKWALVFTAAFTVVYGLTGTAMVDAMTDIDHVRAAAYAYLPWAIGLPLISVWSFVLDGVFIGATRTQDMRNAMALCTLAFGAAAYALIPTFGNHGLWAAFAIFMAARAVTLGWKYPGLLRAI